MSRGRRDGSFSDRGPGFLEDNAPRGLCIARGGTDERRLQRMMDAQERTVGLIDSFAPVVLMDRRGYNSYRPEELTEVAEHLG